MTMVNGVPRYILFTHGDEQFSNERKEELVRKNIRKLFIAKKDLKKYFKYQENNLKYIIEDKNRNSEEKSEIVYDVAKSLAMDIMNDPRSGEQLDRATKWVDNTVSYILNDENTFSSLFQVTSHDYYTYTHCINLSVIGLLFGKSLSLNPYELNCLGKGLLLHDIGKTEIPLEIINKPGKLTKEEFEIVKSHPEAGIRLLKCKEGIDESSLKIVIQHHENYDGTGYPYKLEGKDIHLFGRISRVIDVYDAITTKRTYAIAVRPFAALREMKDSMQNCFDIEIFKGFINFLGPKDPRRTRREIDPLYIF